MLFVTTASLHAQNKAYWIQTDANILKRFETGLFTATLPNGNLASNVLYSSDLVERVNGTKLAEDPNFELVPLLNGGYVSFGNVSIFEKYDANNRLVNTISNSSGSSLGEGVSSWHTNPNQSLWVLTNPLIKTSQGEGSAASIWAGEQTKNLFYSATDKIEAVGISDNGLFIAIVSASRNGQEGEISVFDRQANALMNIEVDDDFEAIGIEFSDDNEYLTLFSSKRAIVYGLPSGKKYGSTSFRKTLIDVELDTASLMLYALTGSLDDQKLSDIEFRMVDFKQSKIEKKDSNKELARVHSSLSVKLEFVGNKVSVLGLKEPLVIN